MSWHYLRVQEEESLQDICLGGELLQPLKSKITHAEFYCNGKLMDSYLDSLSGTTYEPSMESLGEEKSMSSQAVFHAKILVPQEKESALMESVQDFGEKWQGSFAKYDPATHSLRTHQCSLFEDSTEYCVTLPKWGLMLDGELWEQRTLAHLIKGTESGLSPTPPPRHLAYTNSIGRWRWNKHKQSERNSSRQSISISSEIIFGEMAYSDSAYGKRNQCTKRSIETRAEFDKSSWWAIEPKLGRVADGVADRVHRLKAIGNGQVPEVAATAWKLLSERI